MLFKRVSIMRDFAKKVVFFSALFTCTSVFATDPVSPQEQEEAKRVLVTMLTAFRDNDLKSLDSLLDQEFELVEDFEGGAREPISRADYIQEIRQWMSEVKAYRHSLGAITYDRLPKRQGYKLVAKISERVLRNGQYEKDSYVQTTFLRRPDEGLKIFRVIYQD